MNETVKRIVKQIKNPKIIVVMGLVGILLICLSSVIPYSDGSASPAEAEGGISVSDYKEQLEKGVKKIVAGISGDSSPTVVITLESGIRYTYADSTQSDSSSSSGDKTQNSSESSTHSYITVRTSDGGEQALLVAEIMPQVRGVAIICEGGDNEKTAEKIKNAVTAALDITSKRVYIAGGNYYEKR